MKNHEAPQAVEAVARALAKESGVSDWKHVPEHGDYDSRDYWCRLARAAIAAITTPPPASNEHAELIAPIECTSTHCERRQECASPSECTGNAAGKASAVLQKPDHYMKYEDMLDYEERILAAEVEGVRAEKDMRRRCAKAAAKILSRVMDGKSLPARIAAQEAILAVPLALGSEDAS